MEQLTVSLHYPTRNFAVRPTFNNDQKIMVLDFKNEDSPVTPIRGFDFALQYVKVHQFEKEFDTVTAACWYCSTFQEEPEMSMSSPVTREMAKEMNVHQSFSVGDIVQVNDEYFMSSGHRFINVTEMITKPFVAAEETEPIKTTKAELSEFVLSVHQLVSNFTSIEICTGIESSIP